MMERSPIKVQSENGETPVKDEVLQEFDEDTLQGEVKLHSKLLILQKGFFYMYSCVEKKIQTRICMCDLTKLRLFQHDNRETIYLSVLKARANDFNIRFNIRSILLNGNVESVLKSVEMLSNRC